MAPALRSRRLADDVESAAYFFVAEALTNVLKHSQSASVEVSLGLEAGMLRVEIADRGVGFEPGAVHGAG